MPSSQSYDPNFRVSAATSEIEKSIFIERFREHYAKAIGAKLGDLSQAKAVTFEFFSNAVRAGLTPSEIVDDMLTAENSGILAKPEFQSNATTTVALIDYIKIMDVPEIYRAAGVPLERDFYKDPMTGKWQPKNQ